MFITLAQNLLNADSSLKLMLKQRISERAAAAPATIAAPSSGPKIELKMNFSNYT